MPLHLFPLGPPRAQKAVRTAARGTEGEVARAVDDSDEALMLRAGAGDRAACEKLVERHLGRIVTFARRTLANKGDAEDVAQEVFLRVWSAAPRWKVGSARFTTWLYRVALNVCLDRAKRREAIPDDLSELADPRPDPSVVLDASEVARRVSAALAGLPEGQRIAVTLCVYQERPHGEAAEIMKLSLAALESLLARGRRAMRAKLRPVAAALLKGQ